MITEEKLDKFVEDRYPNVQDRSAYVIKNILKHVIKYEDLFQKGVENFTFDEFKIMFESQKWTVNRSSFTKNKSIITSYIFWLQQIDGKVYDTDLKQLTAFDVNKQSSFGDRYFKSEEDLIDFLRKSVPEEVHLRIKAIAVLSWVGFSLEEIALLKKEDLNSKELTIKGEKVSERIFYIVSSCAEQTCYSITAGKGKAKVYRLIDNEYIIRVRNTKESTKDCVTLAMLNNLVGKANRYIKNNLTNRRQISTRAIMKSGFFYHLRELEYEGTIVTSSYTMDESKVEDLRKVSDLLKRYHSVVSADTICYSIMTYREWEKYFYPEEK